jgi:hypothetical protein
MPQQSFRLGVGGESGSDGREAGSCPLQPIVTSKRSWAAHAFGKFEKTKLAEDGEQKKTARAAVRAVFNVSFLGAQERTRTSTPLSAST